MTPIFVTNTNPTGTDINLPAIINVQLVLENGTTIACPGRMVIPPGDTAMVPVQGRSLVKRNPSSTTNGDQLQIKTNTANVQLWASAEIKPSSENTLES
jgi:hypothetical protein